MTAPVFPRLVNLSQPSGGVVLACPTLGAGMGATFSQFTLSLWQSEAGIMGLQGVFKPPFFPQSFTLQTHVGNWTADPATGAVRVDTQVIITCNNATGSLISFMAFDTTIVPSYHSQEPQVGDSVTAYYPSMVNFLVSIDTVAMRVQVYANDTLMAPDTGTLHAGSVSNTAGAWQIASIGTGIEVPVGDIWISNQALDLSVAATRRQFINADLTAAAIADNGHITVAGSTVAPIVFFHLAAADAPNAFATNRGTGPAWTATPSASIVEYTNAQSTVGTIVLTAPDFTFDLNYAPGVPFSGRVWQFGGASDNTTSWSPSLPLPAIPTHVAISGGVWDQDADSFDGRFTFTPDPDFSGSTEVQYTAQGQPGVRAVGTVTFNVPPPPVATPTTLNFVTGDMQVVTDSISPTQLTISLWACFANPDQTLSFTGAGSVEFLTSFWINAHQFGFSTAAFAGTFTGFAGVLCPTPVHVLFSIDVSAQTVSMYWNDQARAEDNGQVVEGGGLDVLNDAGWAMTNPGGVADIWIDERYVDFSQVENRRKFIFADLTPVDLGSSGDLPFGGRPTHFLHLYDDASPDDFVFNYGQDDNWSVTGDPLTVDLNCGAVSLTPYHPAYSARFSVPPGKTR